MPAHLSPAEDAELRWLVSTALTSALTPAEQKRLASLQRRDRRTTVRAGDAGDWGESRSPLGTPADDGAAAGLSRRLVDLIVDTGGVKVILLMATNDKASFEQVVAALPEDVRAKARELMAAIHAQLAA